MTRLVLELPESILAALHCGPQELSDELRFAAAVEWYESGKVSQEVASQIAGLDRVSFLLALARLGKNSFLVDFHDLDEELARG